ncbi:hypothetical protein F5Y15DRAFT_106870 [Xylariaceae sp. FL0016]|nr:hypothetical protein F5Y15DRAFT_106870 [Xylariaceae sp. FL0016]
MPSTTKVLLRRVFYFVPGVRSSSDDMAAQPNIKPTDSFAHRYANPDVLKAYLQKLPNLDANKIRIKATKEKGLEAQLPRKLNKEEKEGAFLAFEEDKRTERAGIDSEDSDSEQRNQRGKV